jgi:hypothetical protein
MEILWNQTNRTVWDRLVRSGGALQQDWSYGAACEALGSTVLRAEIRDAGDRIGALQLIHRPFLRVLHVAVGTRGPVWRDDISTDRIGLATLALAKTLPLPSWRGLFITPEHIDQTPLKTSGFRRVMTPYATVRLDLTQPAVQLRNNMHQKWRNRLVAAENSNLTVQRTDARPEQYLWLLEAEEAQQTRLRYRALPTALVPAWQSSGGQVRVYTANRGNAVVAAMLFLLHGDRATYHIGYSNDDGRRMSAHNLLLWTAMRRLPKAGISTLDLGGLNTQESPGIARFKLGTGGTVQTLCGTWFSR